MTLLLPILSRRKLLPLVLLLVFGVGSSLWAQDGGGAPRIDFDRKTHDFGEVFQGGSRKTSFVFRNLGDAPLTIRKVKTTCGCTAVLMSSDKLNPGEEGEIAVEFSSKDKIGYQDLRVYLYSNDPQEKDFGHYVSALRLSAQVSSLWNVLPGAAYFGSAVRGQRLERRVQVVLSDRRTPAFELREVISPRPWLEVSTKPLAEDLAGGKAGLELTVALTADAPVGLVNETIEVVTDHPDQPRVSVPVIATLTGEVVWSPLQLNYQTVERGEAKERALVIERPDQEPLLEVLEVEIHAAPGVDTDALLEVTVQEVIARRRVEVLVKVREDAPPGPFWALVRVFLQDPDEPLVEVPAFGMVVGQVRVDPPALIVDQSSFSVVLTSFGGRKISVIKEVRAQTGLGLAASKALVDEVPSVIKRGLSKVEAELLKSQLEAAGGLVKIEAARHGQSQLVVQRRDGASFRITGLEVPEGLLVLMPAVAGEISKWVIPVACRPGSTQTSSGVLVLKTNIAGEERVEVPVRLVTSGGAPR